MKPNIGTWAALTAASLGAFAASGCSKQLQHMMLPNQRPTVRLTAAPIDTAGRYFYSYILDWVGFDPDGRVDHYLYAVDPSDSAGRDTAWIVTRNNEERLQFRSSQPDPLNPRFNSRDFHIFVIKAVDDRGEPGPWVARAFFSFTQAPTVQITNPKPSELLTQNFTPALRVSWRGDDPDGVFTQKPVKYKYKLLTPASEFPPDSALGAGGPERLRDRYAPLFAGWDSTSADTTTAKFTNLTPGNDIYVFAVVAFDEAGAYSPIFSLATNMLKFKVGYAASLGPVITFFNDFFNYTYPTGGYFDPSNSRGWAPPGGLEVPGLRPGQDAREGQPLTINWEADPGKSGADIRSYRWALDIRDVTDNTPRQNEHDLAHWSSRNRNTTSATVGPFLGGEEHKLYLEVEDDNGLVSLGIVRFQTIAPTFDVPGVGRDILIVDDMRLQADKRSGLGCYETPAGFWPTAAELDTFLYAAGGNPMPCPYDEEPDPASRVSQRGLFFGYPFDTIGTRIRARNLTLPLRVLDQYKHVIWLVDGYSGQLFKEGTNPNEALSALRYMSDIGHSNTLATYVKQGGQVWAAGGGVAFTSTIPWNNMANDQGGIIFSSISDPKHREVAPGRFMYDMAFWRSEYRCPSTQAKITRFTGRFGDSLDYHSPGYAPSPYADLPIRMRLKSPAMDPLPPFRTSGLFYKTGRLSVEMLQLENYIIEDVNPDPDTTVEVSTLDTLFRVNAQDLPPYSTNHQNVVMTYYHGTGHPDGTGSPDPGPTHERFVFTGFSIWEYTREDCMRLVDFVLHNIWGYPIPNRGSALARGPRVESAKGSLREGLRSIRGGAGTLRLKREAGQLRVPARPPKPAASDPSRN